MPRDADVISIDLPWGDARGRTAIARRSKLDGIGVVMVTGDPELIEYVDQHAAPNALVLLDVPVDGCEALSERCPRRKVDDRFHSIGLPILPSVKSGMRGPDLAKQLRARRRDLRIGEIYPYATLRVLWALELSGRVFAFEDDATEIDVSQHWWSWPPKYKRAKTVALKRTAMRDVARLVDSVPGFAGVVAPPREDSTTTDLAKSADRYDALLGLVAGIADVDASTWAWHATTADRGSIYSIADGWLRRRFAEASRAHSGRIRSSSMR